MQCRRCNSILPDDATFCPNCGASLPPENKKLQLGMKKKDKSIPDINSDDKTDDETESSCYEQDTSIPAMIMLFIISMILPIIGFILFLLWINRKPKASTICCYGAILSSAFFVTLVVISIHNGTDLIDIIRYTPSLHDIKDIVQEILPGVLQ